MVFGGDREEYDEAKAEGRLLDIAERSFYNNMRAYDQWTADLDFDPGALADDLERIVVEPLEDMQEVFDEKPYLTRLYTTLSADEMTVDPMFDYNPDLPGVANVREADARWDCGGSDQTPLEEWELIVTLADGREVRSRPFEDGGPRPFAEPAAATVEQLRTSGPPEILRRPTAVETAGAPASTPADWALQQNYPNPFNRGDGAVLSRPPPVGGCTARLQPPGTESPHPVSGAKSPPATGRSTGTDWTGTAGSRQAASTSTAWRPGRSS